MCKFLKTVNHLFHVNSRQTVITRWSAGNLLTILRALNNVHCINFKSATLTLAGGAILALMKRQLVVSISVNGMSDSLARCWVTRCRDEVTLSISKSRVDKMCVGVGAAFMSSRRALDDDGVVTIPALSTIFTFSEHVGETSVSRSSAAADACTV
jgi:hypothetical protein